MSRAKVAESLADRGRPAMWANEMQAAELSGVSRGVFRAKVAAWEKRGFPQKNPENGKRSIPAILAFWRLAPNPTRVQPGIRPEDDDDDGEENFGDRDQGKRLSS